MTFIISFPLVIFSNYSIKLYYFKLLIDINEIVFDINFAILFYFIIVVIVIVIIVAIVIIVVKTIYVNLYSNFSIKFIE